MISQIAAIVGMITLTAVGQVLLKKGSKHGDRGFSKAYLNVPTITAYGLYLVSNILTVYAFTAFTFKLVYVAGSLVFIVVPILSWLILKETISKRLFYGCLLIVIGVALFNAPIML